MSPMKTNFRNPYKKLFCVYLLLIMFPAINVQSQQIKRGTSQGLPDAHLHYIPGKPVKYWSLATAETVMARYPDYREAYWKPWSYVQGYIFYGFDMLYRLTGDRKYIEFIKKYIDHFVDEQGNFNGAQMTNLDNIMTGNSIVLLYEYTKDMRYKIAAEHFRKAFDTYPRSSDGQFWHGDKSPNMWIDGVFMGQMFLIRYGKTIGDREYCFNEAARQVILCARHLQKGNTGLYLHAWTEKPEETPWADPHTGLSPEVWSEGMGWFALIVAEILAEMPKDHPQYAEILKIYHQMAEGLKRTQDPSSGGWYMIVDKGGEPGNWIDPSGTGMFVYALQRGIDLGILDGNSYSPVVSRGYSSLVSFARINERGLVDIHGGGDGISVKPNYETYVNYQRMVNAKETVGSFLWGTTIVEKPSRKSYIVSNMDEYNATIPTLQAGDEIILKNGIWKDAELVFTGKGLPDVHIYLRAETPGKVRLEGKSCLKLAGEYLHVSGLVFTNGYTPSGSVIEFKNNSHIADHCTVSNCVIDGFSNPEKSKQDFWIQMNGKNNTIEYCYLAGKSNKGMTLTVRLDSLTSVETNHHIYRNYFGRRDPLGENGGETIQIGLSETSQLNAWTKIEENYFDHCDGELEIISVKSCENLIMHNVFNECRGMLTLRHGHRNMVYGNIFLGNGKEGTGGVRIINKNQKVFNNFFSGLRGKGVCSALVLVNGIPNAKPKEYDQVKNAVIFSNTFYDCSTPFQFGFGNDAVRSMAPMNTILANNLVYCTDTEELIGVYDKTDGIRLENNLMIGKKGKLEGENMADGEISFIKKEKMTVPVSNFAGTMPDEALLDKNKYGPAWWPIN